MPGFKTGKTNALFQMAGMSELATDKLKSSVKYRKATGPRCLRWRTDKPSGPMAEEYFARLMAWTVSSKEKGVKLWSSW